VRPPYAQHSTAERDLLQRHAAGARRIVEIGVAEGGSALELRRVMDPAGELLLVDPYPRGRLGVSCARITARRTVARERRGTVRWLRATSADAAATFGGDAIDFLFVDGDHAADAVRRDWELWSPFVPVGGAAALHDARHPPEGWGGDRAWIDERAGPVLLAAEIRRDRRWRVAGEAETTVVFTRVA